MRRLDIVDAVVVVSWFVLAGFVLVRLTVYSDNPSTPFAAWCGGVLSLMFAQLLVRRYRRKFFRSSDA